MNMTPGFGGGLGVMVACVCPAGELPPSALELLSAGHHMASGAGEPLYAAIAGHGLGMAVQKLQKCGLDEVLYCDDEVLCVYTAQNYASALCRMVREAAPRIVLVPAMDTGRDTAARLAAMLGTGLTADCIALELDAESGLMHQTRPAFDGNILATIVCKRGWPQMATVRPGVFPPLVCENRARAVPARAIQTDFPSGGVSVLLQSALPQENAEFASADIIVAVGRGVRGARGLALAKEFAQAAGGVLGASRAAVEEGILPYERQIGQTGKLVHPRLYVACGISGSAHHMAGVHAKTVLAVNHDAEAPIFAAADYGICGEVADVLPKLTAMILAFKA